MTTRTVVARGSDWGRDTLGDGWGDETPDEKVKELVERVVALFHERTQHLDLHWTPMTSEVTAPVEGPELPDLEAIREEVILEVWTEFID